MAPRTYTTIGGEVLDLSGLSPDHARYFDEAFDLAWRTLQSGEGQGPLAPRGFNEWLNTTRNPLLRPTSGFVTREVWAHPLYRALHDLDMRLGMKQGYVRAPRHKRWLQDPRQDTFLPVAQIAARKRVQVKAVHKAIERGDLVAVAGDSELPGPRTIRLVSARSAAAWRPKRVRASA